MKKILTIKNVIINITESNPPTLQIQAEGEVPTTGWTGGILSPYIYIMPPQDGIYEFDFIAHEPGGIVNEVITPINTTYYDEAFDPEIKGVKVNASGNYIKALISGSGIEHSIRDNGNNVIKKSPEAIKELLEANNHFDIINVFIWENVLHVTVRYGGGCREHDFKLLWDGTTMESLPPQVNLYLFHDSKQDPCKAIVEQELQFTLPDELMGHTIHLEGWRAPIEF